MKARWIGGAVVAVALAAAGAVYAHDTAQRAPASGACPMTMGEQVGPAARGAHGGMAMRESAAPGMGHMVAMHERMAIMREHMGMTGMGGGMRAPHAGHPGPAARPGEGTDRR